MIEGGVSGISISRHPRSCLSELQKAREVDRVMNRQSGRTTHTAAAMLTTHPAAAMLTTHPAAAMLTPCLQGRWGARASHLAVQEGNLSVPITVTDSHHLALHSHF